MPHHTEKYHIISFHTINMISFFSVEGREKSKCEKERDDAGENGPLVGAFIPECEEDGSYSEVQCYGSTGSCWCVDSEGNELAETKVRSDRINCTKGEWHTVQYHLTQYHTNNRVFNNRRSATNRTTIQYL
jgi:hypothetical protein